MTQSQTTLEVIAPTWLLGLAETISTARRAGILEVLIEPGGSADEIADRLELSPRAARKVLHVLAACGLAEPDGKRYVASQTLQRLATDAPGGLEFCHRVWDQLPPFLASGTPAVVMDGDGEARNRAYADVAEDLGRWFSASASQVAEWLDGEPAEILDVGAGSGVWSLEMARRSETARVTGIDFSTVLGAFERRARSLGLENRVSTLPGNAFEVDLPGRAFDRIVLANLLRLEPPERARALLQHVAPALAEGGELVVIDTFAVSAPTGDQLAPVLYDLHLALRTRSGSVHPLQTVREWLADLGLVSTRHYHPPAGRAGESCLVATG